MSRKVSAFAIAALLIVTMVFAACSNAPAEAPPADAPATDAPATDAPAAEAASDLTFGYLAYDLADVWNQYGMEAFQWCAEKKGVEVKSLDAQKKPETQVSQAQELINLGVDAIALYPITPESGATIVRMANEAGIPISVENMFLPDGSGDMIGNIACQYNDIGFAAIEYTANQFPGSKMLWVQGSPGLGVTEVYAIGVDEALEIYGDKVEVVGKVNGEFATDPAYKVTTDFINSGKEFDVIFAQNDLMAFGAYNALKENGMEDIPIFSTGGSPQGYQMMQDGQQFANMTAPVNIQGVHQFNFLWRHLNGLDIPEVKVPLPIIPVDVNSIDDWIHWDDFQAAYDFIGGIEP
jgi:ABC-type sugar transport system, periplasmic component